jgi:hypothetical protein
MRDAQVIHNTSRPLDVLGVDEQLDWDVVIDD